MWRGNGRNCCGRFAISPHNGVVCNLWCLAVIPVWAFAPLFAHQKRNRLQHDIRDAPESIAWGYSDTRSRFHGYICRPMGEEVCPVHPHNRQRSVCRHNSGRYVVWSFLYISVMNSCSLPTSFLFPLVIALSHPVPLSRLMGCGTVGRLGTLRDILRNDAPAYMTAYPANETIALYNNIYNSLFHDLSSLLPCPANSSVCLASLIVPSVPSCPVVPLAVGWDGGTGRDRCFLPLLAALDNPADGGLAAIHL